jgi:hypothetical protein
LANPGLHTIPHSLPSQVAIALGPVGHGAQLAPQVAGSSSLTHAAPQAWKSASHPKPHRPPVHVASPLAHAPQSSTDADRSTHSPVQSVGAVGGHSSVQPNAPGVGVGAQYGVVAPQVTLHAPQ